MQIGMIGLGRMGANMVRRLQRAGHQCVVFDRSPEAVQALAQEGATATASLADFMADSFVRFVYFNTQTLGRKFFGYLF